MEITVLMKVDRNSFRKVRDEAFLKLLGVGNINKPGIVHVFYNDVFF